MPLLILVALVLLAVPVFIALIPLSLFLRYRAGTARRQARGWVATLNLVAILISVALFLGTAAVTNFWVPNAVRYSVLGLAVGCVLGLLGLWWSRWETTPETLHYTPNRLLVLTITVVVLARMAFGLWRGWHAWGARAADTSWLAAAGAAGSLGAGAVVLGYYLMYWAGLSRQVKRHRRGALRASPTR
jgi:hypothetical protein